jgi:hypothetical protein
MKLLHQNVLLILKVNVLCTTTLPVMSAHTYVFFLCEKHIDKKKKGNT